MFSLGNSVVESPCVHGAGVIGRVSVADAFSLSLSLWPGWLSAKFESASPLRRAERPAWILASRLRRFMFLCRCGSCAWGGLVLPGLGQVLSESLEEGLLWS